MAVTGETAGGVEAERAALARPARARSFSARALLERLVLSVPWGLERPVVFVLGLPRSGTTLVTEYLVHRLELAHWTAGAARHPRAPLVTTFLERRRATPADFDRRGAETPDTPPPRETDSVWGRFFDPEQGARLAGPQAARALRSLVAATQRVCGGGPFVDESASHGLRIGALAEVFPESLFTVVRRRIQDVAISILRARLATRDPALWWSVRPPEWERLAGLPLEEQVAGQVRGLRRELDAGLAALPRERVIALDYERFCREPDATLGPLRRLLGAVGERNVPTGAFAAVHLVPADARERRLAQLVADADAREPAPEAGRSGGE